MWILINMCSNVNLLPVLVMRKSHYSSSKLLAEFSDATRKCLGNIAANLNLSSWVCWSWRLVGCASCMMSVCGMTLRSSGSCVTGGDKFLCFDDHLVYVRVQVLFFYKQPLVTVPTTPDFPTLHNLQKQRHFIICYFACLWIIAAKHEHVMLWCRQNISRQMEPW